MPFLREDFGLFFLLMFLFGFFYFMLFCFFYCHRGKWCIWKAYTGSETPVLGISQQLTGPYSQAARCICMWLIELAYTQYDLCLFINTTVWFIFCWGHAHRPGPRSPFLRPLPSGLGRAAFCSCCPVPAGRMLLHPAVFLPRAAPPREPRHRPRRLSALVRPWEVS